MDRSDYPVDRDGVNFLVKKASNRRLVFDSDVPAETLNLISNKFSCDSVVNKRET